MMKLPLCVCVCVSSFPPDCRDISRSIDACMYVCAAHLKSSRKHIWDVNKASVGSYMQIVIFFCRGTRAGGGGGRGKGGWEERSWGRKKLEGGRGIKTKLYAAFRPDVCVCVYGTVCILYKINSLFYTERWILQSRTDKIDRFSSLSLPLRPPLGISNAAGLMLFEMRSPRLSTERCYGHEYAFPCFAFFFLSTSCLAAFNQAVYLQFQDWEVLLLSKLGWDVHLDTDCYEASDILDNLHFEDDNDHVLLEWCSLNW